MVVQSRRDSIQEGSAHSADQDGDLADQLRIAQAELEALELAVDELPAIFEHKCRQGLAAVHEANRQLAAQHSLLLHAYAAALSPAPKQASGRRQSLGVTAAAAAGCAVLVWGGVGLWQAVLQRPLQRWAAVQAPLAPPQGLSPPVGLPMESQSLLVLRAAGTSWVEVQDLGSREVLLIGELQAGEQRSIRLRRGLRLRSGRPDLISLQIDDQPPGPFGEADAAGWRTVLPPVVKTEAA